MKEPELVADCINEMSKSCKIPVTAKKPELASITQRNLII